ncbi:MAG: DUF4375 domain-containing protein [Polaromonas sp.]|nr:DUF4375 domain-containing protein [Polaromonas sp.]
MKPDDYWTLIEPVWDTISIYEGGETFLAQYQASPEVSRVLFAAYWCQSEIRNGGFGQFFFNSTGVLAPEAAAAFRTLGMTRTGDLLVRAMETFKGPYPRDRDTRHRIMNEFAQANPDAPEPFEVMDAVFFDLLDTEAGGFEAAADRYAAEWRRNAALR